MTNDHGMTFGLTGDRVPDPPDGDKWADILRWLICVMDADDKSFAFVAGVFAHCLKNGGYVTERQSRAANRIWKRVFEEWQSDVLDCQHATSPGAGQAPAGDSILADMEPEGEA